MSIRKARPDDLERMLDLGELMHTESRYAAMSFNRNKVRALLRTMIQGGFAMVAEREGRIIGGFVGMVTEHWFSDDKLASDIALFIEPESRGSMSVVRLIDAFLTWARQQGAAVIDLGINTGVHTNQTGQLYERLGGRLAGLLYSFEGD